MLFGVARPESVPDPVPKLTALSLTGGVGAGFLPPATGLFAGGAGGVGFALAAACWGSAWPLNAADGTGRAGAAGGGGGGGPRCCSISST